MMWFEPPIPELKVRYDEWWRWRWEMDRGLHCKEPYFYPVEVLGDCMFTVVVVKWRRKCRDTKTRGGDALGCCSIPGRGRQAVPVTGEGRRDPASTEKSWRVQRSDKWLNEGRKEGGHLEWRKYLWRSVSDWPGGTINRQALEEEGRH